MYTLLTAVAVLLDRLVGDPKSWHPVIWIGQLISFLEKRLNKGNARKLKGAFTAIAVIAVTTAIVYALTTLAASIHIALWLVVEVLLISLALAQKSLKESAFVVADALEANDMTEARTKLGWIVGRDTAHLDEPEIVRGVVETVSENTSDGVTAPLLFALCFGATGAWCYKAINTLDSMIAYKNERYEQFGFIAAKLDDIANFIPSRLTGFLLLVATKAVYKQPFRERFTNWRAHAKLHPSPNSGYLEAATAWQLGIRLGGYNRYGARESFRAYMGEPYEILQRKHIEAAIAHMHRVVLLITIGGVFIYAISRTWSESGFFI